METSGIKDVASVFPDFTAIFYLALRGTSMRSYALYCSCSFRATDGFLLGADIQMGNVAVFLQICKIVFHIVP